MREKKKVTQLKLEDPWGKKKGRYGFKLCCHLNLFLHICQLLMATSALSKYLALTSLKTFLQTERTL